VAGLIEIDWRPPRRTLRQFGLVALVGFGGLAACAWFERLVFTFGLGAARPWVAGGLAALGLLAAACSLVRPEANRPLYVGLSLAAWPIGFVVSHLILAAIFYGVILPVGLGLRLAGRDPLARRFDRGAGSYWVEARPERPRSSYFKQF
jgi:hypothetical protein